MVMEVPNEYFGCHSLGFSAFLLSGPRFCPTKFSIADVLKLCRCGNYKLLEQHNFLDLLVFLEKLSR